MTKKDFEIIAAALKASRPDTMLDTDEERGAWYRTAVSVREAVGATNPRFNANTFDLAAGIAGK